MSDRFSSDYDKKIELTPLRAGLDAIIGRIDPTGEKMKRQTSVETYWKNVVGETAAGHTVSVYLKKSSLIVILDSSIWAQELSMFSNQYIERINALFGATIIQTIHYKVGNRTNPHQ